MFQEPPPSRRAVDADQWPERSPSQRTWQIIRLPFPSAPAAHGGPSALRVFLFLRGIRRPSVLQLIEGTLGHARLAFAFDLPVTRLEYGEFG